MASNPSGALPDLSYAVDLGIDKLYDVKFYPWAAPDADPVFAATGSSDTVVCRLRSDKFEVIQWFHDYDASADLNSVAWGKNPATGSPLLCVAGTVPSIKVLNTQAGTIVTTLLGHGANVNDLRVSFQQPSILASCAADHEIRLWSLDPQHSSQPCLAILAGIRAHKMPVLTLAFHSTGRYLLSGGMDTFINMWAVPTLPDANSGTGKATQVSFPHFSTCEVHSNHVDCIMFYGDLILSRSAEENRILLWRIRGFNSDNPVPNLTDPFGVPRKTNATGETSSRFGKGWDLLMSFNTPSCKDYYMRFGLLDSPLHNPVLAMGNSTFSGGKSQRTTARVWFWDLARLEHADTRERPIKTEKKPRVPSFDNDTDTASVSSGSVPPGKHSSAKLLPSALRQTPAHKEVIIPSTWVNYQCDWSTGGEYCVVAGVGKIGQLNILSRWHSGGARPDVVMRPPSVDSRDVSPSRKDRARKVIMESDEE